MPEPEVVNITFQPGRLGCLLDFGRVCRLDENGQAKDLGVQVGWVIESIDGTTYSAELVEAKVSSGRPYVLTFSTWKPYGSLPEVKKSTLGSSNSLRGGVRQVPSQRGLLNANAGASKAAEMSPSPPPSGLSPALSPIWSGESLAWNGESSARAQPPSPRSPESSWEAQAHGSHMGSTHSVSDLPPPPSRMRDSPFTAATRSP